MIYVLVIVFQGLSPQYGSCLSLTPDVHGDYPVTSCPMAPKVETGEPLQAFATLEACQRARDAVKTPDYFSMSLVGCFKVRAKMP